MTNSLNWIAIATLSSATCVGWAEARTPEHKFNNANKRSTYVHTAAAIKCHRTLCGPHKVPGEYEHVDRFSFWHDRGHFQQRPDG